MKNRRLLLLPLFMLVLAGCKPTPQPSPSSEEPNVSVTSDSEELPSVPVSEVPTFEAKTIAEIRAMTEDGASASAAQKELFYQTTGVVTSKFRGANISNVGPGWNITIQDGNDALLLYAIGETKYADKFADVAVGSELTVSGNLAAYNGLRELGSVEYISHKAATAVAPEVLTDISQAALAGKDSKLVRIEGLTLHAKPTLTAEMNGDRTNISLSMDIRKNDVAIGTYMHYNIPLAEAEATMELLRTVTSNSTLNWTGVLGMNNKVFQLTNAHVSEWEVTVGDPVVLSGLEIADATKTLVVEQTYKPALTFVPFDAPEAAATWTSSNDAVATVTSDGEVQAIAEGTATITAAVGDKTAEVVVTVEAETEVEGPVATDLFISEYIEGSSSNKALEIFNGTGKLVDLTGYKLRLYSNGSATADDTNLATLEGSLAHGETVVIVNAGADPAFKVTGAIESTVTYFNGDDAVTLEKDDVIVDLIGVVGVRPDKEWTGTDANGEAASTLDRTLVRDKTVISPNTTFTWSEWIGHPNNSQFLGAHEFEPVGEVNPLDDLFIYEVFGGGGNTGAPFSNDYVVLYNGSDEDIDLAAANLTLGYASATGSFGAQTENLTYDKAAALSGTIESETFFLISLGAGNNKDLPLPVVDFAAGLFGGMSVSGTNGKMALYVGDFDTKVITGSDDEAVIDFVGFGTATDFEGAGAAPAPSNTTSIRRKALVDTNDNAADFEVISPITLDYLLPQGE